MKPNFTSNPADYYLAKHSTLPNLDTCCQWTDGDLLSLFAFAEKNIWGFCFIRFTILQSYDLREYLIVTLELGKE